MEEYLGVAKEEEISDKEIGTALSIAMAVSGCRVRAQFKEVRARSLAGGDEPMAGVMGEPHQP